MPIEANARFWLGRQAVHIVLAMLATVALAGPVAAATAGEPLSVAGIRSIFSCSR
jgi:hypothetical protein